VQLGGNAHTGTIKFSNKIVVFAVNPRRFRRPYYTHTHTHTLSHTHCFIGDPITHTHTHMSDTHCCTYYTHMHSHVRYTFVSYFLSKETTTYSLSSAEFIFLFFIIISSSPMKSRSPCRQCTAVSVTMLYTHTCQVCMVSDTL